MRFYSFFTGAAFFTISMAAACSSCRHEMPAEQREALFAPDDTGGRHETSAWSRVLKDGCVEHCTFSDITETPDDCTVTCPEVKK